MTSSAAEQRRRLGRHYTPDDVAITVARLALQGWDHPSSGSPLVVVDPACGEGSLLAGAAVASPVPVALWGADLDGDALDALPTRLHQLAPQAPEPVLIRADGLSATGADYRGLPVAGADLVVANPPFLGQLRGVTVRSRHTADALQARFGDPARGYVDTAGLFVLASLDLVRPGGRVGIIVPTSLLTARDGSAVRAAIADRASLVGLWSPDEALFEAAVHVVVLVLQRHDLSDDPSTDPSTEAMVVRWKGRDARPAPSAPSPASPEGWGVLLGLLGGVPHVDAGALGAGAPATLGAIATVTAGFRDQYYGIVDHVVEAASVGVDLASVDAQRWAPLVTVGLIDPGVCAWGTTPVRFARRRWQAPLVDRSSLRRAEPALARWSEAVLEPKVVVASQTRVLEAVADVGGAWWPSVPAVAVVPHDPDELWRVLAVLCAPPIAALVAGASAGSGMARGTVRVSARSLRALPLPSLDQQWNAAAELVRQAQHTLSQVRRRALLVQAGEQSCAAYRCASGELLAWWAGVVDPNGPEDPQAA